ncbi:MAG: hypothetical protein ACRYGI_09625 [Janthinobacterium lividum]
MKKFALGQGVRLKSGGPLMVYGGTLGNTDVAYLTGIIGTQTYSSTVAEDQLEAVDHETDTFPRSMSVSDRPPDVHRHLTADVESSRNRNCLHTG